MDCRALSLNKVAGQQSDDSKIEWRRSFSRLLLSGACGLTQQSIAPMYDHSVYGVHHKARVLVVDDDLVDRRAIQRLMADRYVVLQAEDALQADAIVRSQPPDCILLDYLMPGTDSLALIGRYTSAGFPVIMLTGEGNEGVAVEAHLGSG